MMLSTQSGNVPAVAQYQHEADRLAAEAAFERDGCPSRVFLG